MKTHGEPTANGARAKRLSVDPVLRGWSCRPPELFYIESDRLKIRRQHHEMTRWTPHRNIYAIDPWLVRKLMRGFPWTRESHCTASSRVPLRLALSLIQSSELRCACHWVILLAHQPQLLYSVAIWSIWCTSSKLIALLSIKIIPCKTAALMRQISHSGIIQLIKETERKTKND